MTDVDTQRLMIKVARLYHTHGMRQVDVAKRLQISQSRVSRLLTEAEEADIVRTVVIVPRDIHAELEETIEEKYGVPEVHVIDVVSEDSAELTRDLADATANLLQELALDAPTVAFTSWSQTLRMTVDAVQSLRLRAAHIVETLGDLGPPALQHEAARSTQRLASLTGGEPVFLRTPGVVASSEAKELLLSRDNHAREALVKLDNVDFTLIGIGACSVDPALRPGDNFFTDEQFRQMRDRGAVGEVCLHFLDAEGRVIERDLDDNLLIGISTKQLKAAERRWGVSGGSRKHEATRAALCGGWVDTLITDTGTAEYLAAAPDPQALPS